MILRLLCGVTVALAAVRPAVAQQPVGPVIFVSENAPGLHFDSDVAADAAGNFVVVWMRVPGVGGVGDEVYGRRFDHRGNPQGLRFSVNTQTETGQGGPAVAVCPSGAFVVVWTSPHDGSGEGVFARRYDAWGVPQDVAEFQVNEETAGNQHRADVAVDAAGNFVVVWQASSPEGSRVRGRRFAASGQPRGSEFGLSASPTDQSAPRAAVLPDGGFVVTWSAAREGEDNEVFARRFDATGVAVGSELQVNSYTTAGQHAPDVAVDAAGGFVVVWESWGRDGSSSAVAAQGFDAAGAPLGAELLVNTYTHSEQRLPSVARDRAGNFLVTWTSQPCDWCSPDEGQDGSGAGVFAQLFDARGTALGGEFRVNGFTTGPQASSALAALDDSAFVVSWYGSNVDYWTDVFAQRYEDLVFRDGFEGQPESAALISSSSAWVARSSRYSRPIRRYQ